MKKKVLVIDSTLRDGSHAISHQFTREHVASYAKAAEIAKTQILIVGHGNGLGASSLHLGFSLLSDTEYLKYAKKELHRTKLGAFLIPGFGTITDIEEAIQNGAEVLMVASHCTEATITRQHIEFSVKKGLRTFGVLMMSHMAKAEILLEEAKKMQDYGAFGVLLMDSAGTCLPDEVTEKISVLTQGLHIETGFHAHNNLGMAVANSIAAVKAGATIIDATSRGMGAGAGNCQLEVVVAVLEKMGIKTGLDLYQLMDNSENIISKIQNSPSINSITLTSGLAGVFSGFAPHAKRAAERFGLDPRDVLMELGKRKVVAGQEDKIIQIALELSRTKS
ncbi:MAG: 4-hydroxy-2-oxovalerate aldolase [bacterium]|nr:4-hydroxy-2-oxovalerate aldolase [bacterium]